jgi:hypothetical protein
VDLFYVGSREIIITFSMETLGVFLTKQCRQGGYVLPLLWSLIMNGLVLELNSGGSYMVGNAKDVTILINRKFSQTVSKS